MEKALAYCLPDACFYIDMQQAYVIQEEIINLHISLHHLLFSPRFLQCSLSQRKQTGRPFLQTCSPFTASDFISDFCHISAAHDVQLSKASESHWPLLWTSHILTCSSDLVYKLSHFTSRTERHIQKENREESMFSPATYKNEYFVFWTSYAHP